MGGHKQNSALIHPDRCFWPRTGVAAQGQRGFGGRALFDGEFHVDVVAGRVGIGAHLMGLGDQRLGLTPRNAWHGENAVGGQPGSLTPNVSQGDPVLQTGAARRYLPAAHGGRSAT